MHKILWTGVLLFSIHDAFAGARFRCASLDFDPATYTGQSLLLAFDDHETLTSAHKQTGSWYCDDVTLAHPKLLAVHKVRIYDAHFGCGERSARLVIPRLVLGSKGAFRASYSFNDVEAGKQSYELSCKAESGSDANMNLFLGKLRATLARMSDAELQQTLERAKADPKLPPRLRSAFANAENLASGRHIGKGDFLSALDELMREAALQEDGRGGGGISEFVGASTRLLAVVGILFGAAFTGITFLDVDPSFRTIGIGVLLVGFAASVAAVGIDEYERHVQ